MNREAIKTFILIILVSTSFFLSYILWTYQPNFKELYNPDYVPEVDIGGKVRTKSDVIEPSDIVFKIEEQFFGFQRPVERRIFYKEFTSWVLYDIKVQESEGKVVDGNYVEMIFPGAVPVESLSSILTFHDTIELPTWSFDRIFLTVNEDAQTLRITILSVDHRNQIVASIEKKETYDKVAAYLNDPNMLYEYITVKTDRSLIYLPKEEVEIQEKTLVLTVTKPELYFNALFPIPSIVTPNPKEAYFTDGQRGMRILNDNRIMEFVFPIQAKNTEITPYELLDISIKDINDHKGWTNDYIFTGINRTFNSVSYQLYYEGYPIISNDHSSVIEQQWRDGDLHQYIRPLTQLSNTLSSNYITLPSGEDVLEVLSNNKDIEMKAISDIKIGYAQNFLNDTHSVVLTPGWYMLYKGSWKKIYFPTDEDMFNRRGGN